MRALRQAHCSLQVCEAFRRLAASDMCSVQLPCHSFFRTIRRAYGCVE